MFDILPVLTKVLYPGGTILSLAVFIKGVEGGAAGSAEGWGAGLGLTSTSCPHTFCEALCFSGWQEFKLARGGPELLGCDFPRRYRHIRPYVLCLFLSSIAEAETHSFICIRIYDWSRLECRYRLGLR